MTVIGKKGVAIGSDAGTPSVPTDYQSRREGSGRWRAAMNQELKNRLGAAG